MSEHLMGGTGRIMLCCNEAVGLGHLRRTLTLAEHLRQHTRLRAQLIITGSPVAQNFPLPQGADYIKLPSAKKRASGEYAPRSIPMSFRAISEMRRDILLSAARHFRPDVLLVDHLPTGIDGEMLPTLHFLKDNLPETRLVLGLRDVIGDPAHVRHSWARMRVPQLLEDLYDLVLVYGQREVHDVVREYGLSPTAAAKVRYSGYLRRSIPAGAAAAVRAELNLQTDRLVVVTVGGGVDGHALLRAAATAVRLQGDAPRFDCVIVTGPLMPEAQRAELEWLVRDMPCVHLLPFADDMVALIAAADVVVGMGGYNTICEILSFERPAVIMPRVAPSTEQLIRVRALAQRRLVRMIHPDALDPAHLLAEIDDLLLHPTGPQVPLAMDGLGRIARELDSLVGESFVPGVPVPVQMLRQGTSR